MNAGHQVYSVRDLLSLRDDPNRWIVRDMIPRAGRTIVFGKEGVMKSTIIFDLCVAVSSRTLLLRQFPVQTYGPVLLVSTEGSIFDNRGRILALARAHGINPIDMQLYYCQQPFCMDDPVDILELEHYIKEIKPAIVVLDPLDSFFAGDENSARETKALRRNIDRLILNYGTAFIVIHHEAKDAKKKGASPRGSGAWAGWADAVLHVEASKAKLGLPEDVEVITVEATKQRNGRKGHVFSAVPDIDEVLQRVTFCFYDGTDKTGVILEYWKRRCFRLIYGASEPLTKKDIAEALGLRPERITDALNALAYDGLIAPNGEVSISFGPGGARSRVVSGWRPVHKVDLVRIAELMVKTEDAILEEESTAYTIDPQPREVPSADNKQYPN